MKINVAADSPQWDKYVNLADMAHNTTYHQSLKCTPSEVFHDRVPFNVLALKFSNPLQCRTQDADLTKLIDQVNEKYKQVNDNILQAYHKYKRYYDRKAQASPLKVNDFVFLLNTKITDQSDKIAFNHFKWEGPFKVVKVLTNFNYIVRKIGTSRTQCVHRMRLRPFIPNAPIHDIEEDPNLFYADPEAFDDQDLFNDHVPQTIHFERTPALPPPEELDTEHGIIYYEQAQRSPDRQMAQPIPENSPQTFVPPTDDPVVSTHLDDENRAEPDQPATHQNELPHNNDEAPVTSRNNTTRYNLRAQPTPKTYRDFLVHELQVKPVLRKLLQNNHSN